MSGAQITYMEAAQAFLDAGRELAAAAQRDLCKEPSPVYWLQAPNGEFVLYTTGAHAPQIQRMVSPSAGMSWDMEPIAKSGNAAAEAIKKAAR